MANELIRVVQLPVMEQLRAMKEQVDQKVADALSLVCTDETLSAVKEVRASLNKDFKALDEQRKAVKKAVMGPYEAFEKVYKECVSGAFNRADYELKGKIADVENAIKGACKEEMRAYFSEMAAAEHVEWLKYEWAGVKVDMASARQKSHAKLREQSAAFVVRVAQDVIAISGMEDAKEIMVEFKRTLDAAEAISIVQERHRRVEAERVSIQTRQEVSRAESIHVAEVKAAEEAFTPPSIVTPVNESQLEAEKCYVAFKVTGTLAQIIALKKFLMDGGYQYEQL